MGLRWMFVGGAVGSCKPRSMAGVEKSKVKWLFLVWLSMAELWVIGFEVLMFVGDILERQIPISVLRDKVWEG